MANKISSESFKHLRVYQRLSVPLILNDMMCNRIMKVNYLVDKAPAMYRIASRLLGKNFINSIIHSTYCRVFSAGATVFQANQTSAYFRDQGIPVILDYCAEGDIDHPDLEATLDSNAALFAQSACLMAQCQDHMISIKMTGLIDMLMLKKWNEAVNIRDAIWDNHSQGGTLNYEGLAKGLKKHANFTEDDIKEYLHKIHNYEGDSRDFVIREVNFKINHHPFYIYDSDKNKTVVMRQLFPLSKKETNKIEKFIKRLQDIIEPSSQNKNNFRILVDAQQTYVQNCIESVTEQLQDKYNQHRAYIIPTIQNYLKRSVARGQMEIRLAKEKNIKFGAKLVRGAYIVEESRLAKQNSYENPIVDNFESTTYNYLTNFQNIMREIPEGEVVVATHNQDTIEEAISIKQKYPQSPVVSFAQLLGLADHLTCQLRARDMQVYKYLPWAQTEVMVPYMIRRAQELNQMKYPLDIQYDLLRHELGLRITLSS